MRAMRLRFFERLTISPKRQSICCSIPPERSEAELVSSHDWQYVAAGLGFSVALELDLGV